ncbi:hypothetical protein PAXINDRAFT_13952 [Paxillus involutus ATCC 200175]|uniref:Uncharacterized protein n=1 Tax=Paxillus involutus ATCC 200175 TaxID=664439 RepID=A0A0C9U179_PAXIN|nr:hypothetical protein PAXINDRAFT_13952 [Paxillus involutus ATCC 200175]
MPIQAPVLTASIAHSDSGELVPENSVSYPVEDTSTRKEPAYRRGQRGSHMTPRSLELFRFVEVPDVELTAKPPFPLRLCHPGTLSHIKTFPLTPHMDPTPNFPHDDCPGTLGGDSSFPSREAIVFCGVWDKSLVLSSKITVAYWLVFYGGIMTRKHLETVDCRWIIGADSTKDDVMRHEEQPKKSPVRSVFTSTTPTAIHEENLC